MVKEQTKTTEQKSSRTNENLQAQLGSVIDAPVKLERRTVKLITQSCCGCGCHDIEISRVVDANSPLQNGDRVTEMLATDQIA